MVFNGKTNRPSEKGLLGKIVKCKNALYFAIFFLQFFSFSLSRHSHAYLQNDGATYQEKEFMVVYNSL